MSRDCSREVRKQKSEGSPRIGLRAPFFGGVGRDLRRMQWRTGIEFRAFVVQRQNVLAVAPRPGRGYSRLMLSEIAVEVVKSITSEVIKRWQGAHTSGAKCTLSTDEAAFGHHLHFAVQWASQISLKDAGTTKQLQELHVDLQVGDSRANVDKSGSLNALSLEDALDRFQNILLLGGPGAGKTN